MHHGGSQPPQAQMRAGILVHAALKQHRRPSSPETDDSSGAKITNRLGARMKQQAWSELQSLAQKVRKKKGGKCKRDDKKGKKEKRPAGKC